MTFISLVRIVVSAGICLLGMPFFSVSQAAEGSIAVLYPDMREPYREVITTILDGIQQEAAREVNSYAIGDSYDRDALREVLVRGDPEVIIALGRGGFAAAQDLKLNKPIVVGALIIAPGDVSPGVFGISLAADPDLLFSTLKVLSPEIKNVNVVYNRANSQWLVSLGQSAAKRHGLKLAAYPVQDSKGAVRVYRDIIANSRQSADAIWLLPDPTTVEDRVILPLILKGAWDKNIAVFSTNPGHVKRGALFSLFPDNKAMGVSLAKLAKTILNGGGEPKFTIMPLTDLQAAVNTRSADHLGLTIPIEMQRDSTLTFPSP